jgi:hypothetical protein
MFSPGFKCNHNTVWQRGILIDLGMTPISPSLMVESFLFLSALNSLGLISEEAEAVLENDISAISFFSQLFKKLF